MNLDARKHGYRIDFLEIHVRALINGAGANASLTVLMQMLSGTEMSGHGKP